jgi:hypothetical protein
MSRRYSYPSFLIQGSRKNKLAITGDEVPGRQGVKRQEYRDIPGFSTGSRSGCIAIQNVKLILSEPLAVDLAR